MNRKFVVITEARALKIIPDYRRYLINGMLPKRPRGYVIQIIPPIHCVQDQPDDVEGIGAVYTNVGKPYVIHTAGWCLYKDDAQKRALKVANFPSFNREDRYPVTQNKNCFG